MSMWTAIVVIVAISAFARVMLARYHARQRSDADAHQRQRVTPDGPGGPADPELQREIETLRKRLEVLERIATDERQSKSIAAEIESLRDR